MVGAEGLRRAGVPDLLALVAILSTACLLPLGGIPLSIAARGVSGTVSPAPTAAPIADAYTPSPTPAVSTATQNPLSSESPKRGDSADVQPTPGSEVAVLAPGKSPPPTNRGAPSDVTPTPVAETTPEPTVSAKADAEAQVVVGTPVLLAHSVEGRAIRGVELGDGPRWIAVIGGIHQGNEANTTDLVNLLLDHFRDNLVEIPDGVGLAFIPDLNPDGAAAGTRTNANGVDLNRNWDAGWQPDTFGPFGVVPGGGGTRPFSEPETRALAGYLVDRPIVAAIFFHSQGGVVIPGLASGDSSGSVELASTITRAAQYIYLTEWTAYPLSGQATDYLAEKGIHVADVELSTHTDPDFARNLRGLSAALAWAQDLPEPIEFQRDAAAEISDFCGCQLGADRASLASTQFNPYFR